MEIEIQNPNCEWCEEAYKNEHECFECGNDFDRKYN